MSKKRPTESSWDSDEELLNDTSGITAFPKNSSDLDLLAADGELEDEDALLSIDEANAKGVTSQFSKDSSRRSSGYGDTGNAGSQDVGVDEQAFVFEEVDTGDLEDELNVPGEEEANYQEQHYAEDINYDDSYGAAAAATDVYHGEDGGEGIAYSEDAAYQNTDANIGYNQDSEVDPNYGVQEGEDGASVELTYEQPEEQEEQVHLEYGDAEVAAQDAVEGSETERQFESESDSDDESSRHNRGKFTTERTGTISLLASKERSTIPDTLELDKEQAEQIDKFMADKNQGGKKSSRGRGGVHSRLGPRHMGPGGPPRLGGPMPPGPNINPNFPMAGPGQGQLSPRMLMGLLRGGAQMLRGLIPPQLLNARGPMAAQSIARALRQSGPFPEGMPGPRGPPPLGVVDPRGPFPRHPPGLMNQMRGPMRPGLQPGPQGMGDGGPLPPRMPGGPFPGPMNPRLPLPVMPQGRMRMMGPRGPPGGPGGPPLPDGPRGMLGPPPIGRGGPRFGGDAMMNPPQIPGLMNRPKGPGPNQPPIRPLIPNAVQIRPGMRNQGPQGPNMQGKAKGLSVHDRLGPRDAKNVPPLMGIDPSKPIVQKMPVKSEQGQPIPSLVKSVTTPASQGQPNRLIRPQGPRFGNPAQMKPFQQKGPPGFVPPNSMAGQARHKIFINPRFQGQQNPGVNKPTGITRTVRFGVPLQQRKAKALVDRAVQNKMNTNFGNRGPNVGARAPVNLKRRSTGSEDVPAKIIRTVGQTGAQPVFVNRDAGKFRQQMEEQKRTPGHVMKRSVITSQSGPIQRLGSSVQSRLGPPTNRNVQPFQGAPPRNTAPGSGFRGPGQHTQPRFAGPPPQRNPRPVAPRMQVPTTPVFRPPPNPATRPPGTVPAPANQFSIPPPSSAPRFQTPPPRMNTRPTVPPPVNVHSAPPRYQAPQQQASPYQTPPPATPPIYPPPPTQVAPTYPPAPQAPTAPPPTSQYPPQSYAPPPQHPAPAHPPPAPAVYQAPQTAYQPPHTTYQPPQTAYQPPQTTYPPPHTTYQPPQTVHQPQPVHYQPPVAAPVAQTPSYSQPAVQPAQTEYPSSYPPPATQYPTPQRQDSQTYFDYSTGTYYPTATTYAAATSTPSYQYTAVPTQPQTSSYYDYSTSTSQHNPVQSYGSQPTHDQRTVQHQSSVGQPIQTIGRRVQPATGSQMRTIVHNVTTSSSASSDNSQSGRIVVDTSVSVLPGPQRVAVYNVAKQATKETLLKVCRHFGKVMNIQFTREQDRAIIQFETGEQAAKCVSKCDQKCLLKTRLTVKLLPN